MDVEAVRKAAQDIQDGLERLFLALGPPEPAPEPQSACEGFQWIGQSWEHCNGCSRPAWEHEGYEEMGASSPFGDGELKLAPWTGLMAEVREKYLQGVRITVQEGEDGGKAIVYVK